ncbi:hypothetical protein [Anatilimnocola floriformis]|uniref:hypothetical protein n=1 Tax=Anatilimnocola floriformis TaxID=2948575 RepID=UPI0020C2189B|nr:hypothetical protein [Anatilimnocola floriformis]
MTAQADGTKKCSSMIHQLAKEQRGRLIYILLSTLCQEAYIWSSRNSSQAAADCSGDKTTIAVDAEAATATDFRFDSDVDIEQFLWQLLNIIS